LDLAAAIGSFTSDEGLSLRIPEAARALARQLVSSAPGNGPLVIVHPGASAESRRYPALSYTAALEELVNAVDCRIVFTGSSSEAPIIERIRAGLSSTTASFAGRLDLAALAALVEAADLLIVNNTGPAHVAAAVGTPIVDLYALTNPQHTPWGVASRVLFCDVPCRFCYKSVCPEGHHACLEGIKPAEVAEAALELLNTSVKKHGSAPAWLRSE
jgi:ADP-heptose:LPS heptosyltransferase